MKRVLYLTNIEVPYRVLFFNKLAKQCDLTVMYERRKSANRDSKWAGSEARNYRTEYLDGMDIGDEYGFSWRILTLLKRRWDAVVIGCYNSKVQILAMTYMRMHRIPFIINLDGEPFIGRGVKSLVKKMVLRGARLYLTAGVKAGESLKAAIGDKRPVVPYYFSSLTEAEIARNACSETKREDFVLVVGQYLTCKGMDVAYKAACMDQSIRYKFVGMGKRTALFRQEMGDMPDNIEVIPFLPKKELEAEYRKCAMLLLPTRQECWGLVVNEASSFGTPIVSTWGSGAAVEFIGDSHPQYLAQPGNAASLASCIRRCLGDDCAGYADHLKDISAKYSIERSVEAHVRAFNSL